MLLDLFLVRFFFNFYVAPCGGLSWLHVSFLLHVKGELNLENKWTLNEQLHIIK